MPAALLRSPVDASPITIRLLRSDSCWKEGVSHPAEAALWEPAGRPWAPVCSLSGEGGDGWLGGRRAGPS